MVREERKDYKNRYEINHREWPLYTLIRHLDVNPIVPIGKF